MLNQAEANRVIANKFERPIFEIQWELKKGMPYG